MSTLTEVKKQQIAEAALFAAGKPLSTKELLKFFPREENLTLKEMKKILETLIESYADKGVVLKEVASGFRFQVNTEVFSYLDALYEEKPAKYSRALMETLALIAYRQPITRGEIEDVRGVGVSTGIINTLLEHEWVKAVGHREVPGRPTLYATTNRFLDYFNLKSLSDLPELAELKDLESIAAEFAEKELAGSMSVDVNLVDGEQKIQIAKNSDEDDDEHADADADADADDENDQDDEENENSENDENHEKGGSADDEEYEEDDNNKFLSEDIENSAQESDHIDDKVELKRDLFEEIAMVVVDEVVEKKPEKKERKNLINNLKSKQKKQFD